MVRLGVSLLKLSKQVRGEGMKAREEGMKGSQARKQESK